VEQVESFWRVDRVFEPRMTASHREQLLAGWREAVARCRWRAG
jgi:glycerol kinase